MNKFDVILTALVSCEFITINEWKDETEQHYGLIQFYSHDTAKTYKMLWDNDTIIKFEEIS